jgi:hypothetical protein
MIFNKILKGTDLSFDMSLEKTEYKPGEIVRGVLTLKTEKSCKARKLVLFAEGKESTLISVSESTSYGSSRDTNTRTYSEINTFFSKDLSHLLQESASINILEDAKLEILPQNKEIAFDFTLPTDDSLLSSYKGKHANITYTVKATADIAKRLDVNKEQQFHLTNYDNNKVVAYSSNTSFNEDNKSDIINSTTIIENENSISPLPTIEAKEEEEEDARKERYSARFEKIFGKKPNRTSVHSRPRYFTSSGTSIDFDLGTMFAKGREHFLKDNSEARIDLLQEENNNKPYSPGDTIKGQVILVLPPNKEQEQNKNKKIRGMKIILSGIEYAFAHGLQRVNTIEKYEKNIGLKGNENSGANENNIPFEFQIPEGINQSYIGKYSEYFWGLEAKVNVAWLSDINARTVIEIV